MKKIRVFVDTSVFGGCFDVEFQNESRTFFELVMRGRFTVVISDTVLKELAEAPAHVLGCYQNLLPNCIEFAEINETVLTLSNNYIEQKVISAKFLEDAEHIAVATIAEVDYIVSWNFKHIVHYDKIKEYNRINEQSGHKKLIICSPKELIQNEERF